MAIKIWFIAACYGILSSATALFSLGVVTQVFPLYYLCIPVTTALLAVRAAMALYDTLNFTPSDDDAVFDQILVAAYRGAALERN